MGSRREVSQLKRQTELVYLKSTGNVILSICRDSSIWGKNNNGSMESQANERMP